MRRKHAVVEHEVDPRPWGERGQLLEQRERLEHELTRAVRPDAWLAGKEGVVPRNGTRERVAIVTGTSAAPTLRRLLDERPPQGADTSQCVVTNEYFGDTVTVSGLLVGADIEAALVKHDPANRVLLPPNCLKESEVFLDDRTRSDLETRLSVPVQIGFDAPLGANATPAVS